MLLNLAESDPTAQSFPCRRPTGSLVAIPLITRSQPASASRQGANQPAAIHPVAPSQPAASQPASQKASQPGSEPAGQPASQLASVGRRLVGYARDAHARLGILYRRCQMSREYDANGLVTQLVAR